VDKPSARDLTIRIFSSAEKAEDADLSDYAKMTLAQRLAIAFELTCLALRGTDGDLPRMERVLRITRKEPS